MDWYLCYKAWLIVSIDTIVIDPSIIWLKLNRPLSVLAIFTLFTIVFLEEVGCFFHRLGKKRRKLGEFFNISFDRLINTLLLIQCLLMDWWPSVREGFYDRLSILSIKNKQSLIEGSITSMKIRPKVSNDSNDRYHWYRSINPSPNVPI
jgi:hypothetical protein